MQKPGIQNYCGIFAFTHYMGLQQTHQTDWHRRKATYHIVKETCQLYTISRLWPSLDFLSASVKITLFKFQHKQSAMSSRWGMQWVVKLFRLESEKKTGCAFHLIHNKSVHWRLWKLKEEFWWERLNSGLCNKHDWFEAGNPLEQKCGTISTVAILFVLILGTTRYVISTIASAVCFYCSPLVENIEVQDLRSYAAFIMNMC